jgi:ATP-dependent exoDNAse (exonuclease V) alpha subunit
VTTITTLHAGHDVRYLTSGDAHGGNAGAMRYYTASGEPPGQWAGKGAAALGLAGAVDGDVMERLYMQHVGPGGELLTRPRGKAAAEDDDQAAAAFRAAHPFASEVEVAEAVAKARGGARVSVPYYDLTVSAAKSVSVLHTSLKISAGDVLVLDEASMISTADLALIMDYADRAGALVVPTGDPFQLGPVEAGGMFGALLTGLPFSLLDPLLRIDPG